jgi:hypothetical protein
MRMAQAKIEILSEKITNKKKSMGGGWGKKAGHIAQVVEGLPSRKAKFKLLYHQKKKIKKLLV